jgi:hypothetical protein
MALSIIPDAADMVVFSYIFPPLIKRGRVDFAQVGRAL